MKIVKVTKDYFETENGEKIEHQFELDEVPTVEEFQKFYDNQEKEIRDKLKKDELKLSERVYICDECGFELDRNLNASLNLKQYTVSSTGINASGDGKVHVSNDRCPSVKEESDSNSSELIACQFYVGLEERFRQQ